MMTSRMMYRTQGKSDLKAKKSYTLSPEIVGFLETERKKRRAGSVSAALEEILQEVRHEKERASAEKAVSDYYSSLSIGEREERTQWGEFALAQLRDED